MSYYLSVLVGCECSGLANNIREYLSADTRPVFEEDVPDDMRALFSAVENIEYPTFVEVDDGGLWICWLEEESIQFGNLKWLFRLNGVTFRGGYEIPDYADSADEDDPFFDEEDDISWYWVLDNDEYRQVATSEVNGLLPKEICARLRSLGEQEPL